MDGPVDRTSVSPLRRGFYRAAVALVGVVASFLTVYGLCRWCDARAAPAILAAILSMTLARREHPIGWKRAVTAPLVLAGTALVATGAAWLLHAMPTIGAAVYVAIIFLSIWLRNFDERAKSIGALIALPLIALLLVPGRANAPGGPLVDLALVVSAGVVSLAYATVLQWLARRFGVRSSAPEQASARSGAQPKRPGISVPTRMALQMAVALAAAFACGYTLFPAHWGWTVMTAFIVCSGARGRGDAAYKGLMRLGGAIGGTLAAALFARVVLPNGPTQAILCFVVLFLGLWLRDVNYAYWAACMTIILALLSRSEGSENIVLLGVRLEAILVGALCAVAAAWFVFPIRTEAVIRRRLADALGALDGFIAREPSPESTPSAEFALFEHRMAELESVAVPMRWHRRVFAAADKPEHPARWIELAHEVKTHARSFVPQRSGRAKAGAVRRAIGLSRRAIADHGKPEAPPEALAVSEALRNLRDVLTTTKSHESEAIERPSVDMP